MALMLYQIKEVVTALEGFQRVQKPRSHAPPYTSLVTAAVRVLNNRLFFESGVFAIAGHGWRLRKVRTPQGRKPRETGGRRGETLA